MAFSLIITADNASNDNAALNNTLSSRTILPGGVDGCTTRAWLRQLPHPPAPISSLV